MNKVGWLTSAPRIVLSQAGKILTASLSAREPNAENFNKLLGIDLVNVAEARFKADDGWTVDARGKAAVWADGFQSFLLAPEAFTKVLLKVAAT